METPAKILASYLVAYRAANPLRDPPDVRYEAGSFAFWGRYESKPDFRVTPSELIEMRDRLVAIAIKWNYVDKS